MHYDKLANYLLQAGQSTLSQLVIMLGPGLALAFVIHLLAGFIAQRACRVMWQKRISAEGTLLVMLLSKKTAMAVVRDLKT